MMKFASALVAMSAVASAVSIDNETGTKQFEVDASSMPSSDALAVNAAPAPVNVDAPMSVDDAPMSVDAPASVAGQP